MANEEERVLENQLEQQLNEQRDSLTALNDALASDPTNSELLEVHKEVVQAIKDAKEGLLHLKRARLLREADCVLRGSNPIISKDVKAEPIDPSDVEPEPLVDKTYTVGSRCRFRYNDGRWYDGQIVGLDDSDSAKISFLTPTSEDMLICKFFLQQRCRFGSSCRLSHGIDVPLSSLKKYNPTVWEQSLVGSTIWALSDDKVGIWRKAELESWDDELRMGEVVFRDDGSYAKLGVDTIAFSEYAEMGDEEESDLSSELSDSSDYEEDTSQGLGFDGATELQRSVQTDTVIFAKWENHTRGIASKMMVNMGYREGMGLGASGQGMLDPISVKVLPPKQSLDHALESHENKEDKENKLKKRSRGGKRKREKKFAAAARAARDEEESRSDVFSLINNQLAKHGEAVNGKLNNKMQRHKGSREDKRVDRKDLVAYDEEIKDLRIQVEKLEEMVQRNKKEKVVYEAAMRKLNETQQANQTEMGEETSPRANSSFFTTIGSSVIPTINKLQDILTPVSGELSKISLPQVAVVGSQSSGKSSVLEALVGRDFLPRGCDICTRRPLALMLENRPRKPDDDGREWAEFRHLPGKRFYDFTTVRREILAETDREAGRNKGVSEKQIGLKISSPNVLNMTLIDLPGITKVPVGDQPSDIETRIRRMIMAFIRQEKCIILAVSPANSDLATSDALQMARDADPTGTRTIGVITKLDIMDRGTNACNFLLGKVVPLRLGYVGVVNRCQEDINKNRSIREALAYEEQFFCDNPEYSGLSDRCGIPKLAKKLNQILEQHVRMVLPSLKAELNSRLTAVAKELQKYGKVVESKAEQEAILLSILARYSEAFSAMVDGKSQEMSTKELSGGARIRYIFQSIFVKTLEEVDPCQDLSDDDIRMAIQNATGPRNALFVPEVPFEVLVRKQIALLLDPCLQCLRFVYDELIKMSRACEVTELQRFPVLRRRLDDVMGKFLRDGVRPAEKMIGNLIEMEMDYINSSHPSFIGGSKAIEIAMQQLKSSQDGMDAERSLTSEMAQRPRTVLPKSIMNGVLATQGTRSQSNNQKAASAVGNSSSRTWGFSSLFGSRAQSGESPASESLSETLHNGERLPSAIQLREPPAILRPLEMTELEAVEIHVTKLLLLSYYDIVRKNIQDLVPKAIMHFLVNHSKRKLHNTCIQKLYRENHVEELLQEQDEVAAIRKHTREAFLVLQQAVQTLDKVESDVSSGTLNSNSGVEAPSGLSKISAYNTWSHPRTNGDSRSSYESSYRNAKAQRLFYSEEVSFPDNSA